MAKKGMFGGSMLYKCEDNVEYGIELAWVDPTTIFEDYEIQRDLSTKLVTRLTNEWRLYTAGTLITVWHNGKNRIIDGRHRLRAAIANGEKLMPIQCYHNITEKMIYVIFHNVNGVRKPCDPLDTFRSGLRGGFKPQNDVWNAVTSQGFIIPLRSDEQPRKNADFKVVRAYGGMMKVYNQYGGRKTIEDVFQVIKKRFLAVENTGQPEVLALQADFIVALGHALYREEYSASFAIRRLKCDPTIAVSWIESEATARMNARGSNNRWGKIRHMTNIIVEAIEQKPWAKHIDLLAKKQGCSS